MAASPAQNASGAMPVFGAASLAMKSNRTGAIFSPWASIRFMMDFSQKRSRLGARPARVFEANTRQGARSFERLLQPNRAPRKALQKRIAPLSIESNIGAGSVKY